MKKVVATIFLLIYFVTSSGATIQLHFCMDKLVGWSMTSKEHSKCDKCGMEKKEQKGCCHDESKFVKLDKVHKATFNYFDLFKFQHPVEKGATEYVEDIFILNSLSTNPTTNAPLLQTKVPIYLSNSVFRI